MLSAMHPTSLLSSDLSSRRPLHTASLLQLHSQLDSQLYLKRHSRLLKSSDLASLNKLLDALLIAIDPSLLGSSHVSTHRQMLVWIDAQFLAGKQPPRRPLPLLLFRNARSEPSENAPFRYIPGRSANRVLVQWPVGTRLPATISLTSDSKR